MILRIRFLCFFTTLLISTLLITNSYAEEQTGEALTIEEKAKKLCASCHGDEGHSVNSLWPNLAGQDETYLYEQLMEYAKGEDGNRNDPVMMATIAGLSNEELRELAAYYASLESKSGKADPALVELGERIYKGGNSKTGLPACSACHADNGSGNTAAKFPKLAGQNPEYIVDQLKKFHSRKRSNDYNEMMRDIAEMMSEEEMKAVASYIKGIQ